MADEPLPQRGISHLVEHLTLAERTNVTEHHNGFVDALTTNFVVHGTPAEVAEHLSWVCSALAQPDKARLALETQILRAEAGRRGGDPAATIMNWRSGANGYGALAYREFFLERPTVEWLRWWISQHFTAANAVLWCTGPLPDGLVIDLPDGEHRPVPEPAWLPEVFPAWNHLDLGGVAVSLIRPTTVTDSVAIEVARARLFEQLRMQQGYSYEVGARSDELGASRSHTLLHADCLPAQAEKVRDAFVTEMRRLCLFGPTDEEVGRVTASFERSLAEAEGSDVAPRARAALLGRPYVTDDSALDQLRSVSTGAIRDHLDAMASTALWVVPTEIGWNDQRYAALRSWSPTRAATTPVRVAAPASEEDLRSIAADEERLTLFFDDALECPVTVEFATCAAMVCSRDGRRMLIGDDGFSVTVEPERWANAASLITWIDQRVPADRIVQLADA